MSDSLLLLGAGGHGKVLIDAALASGRWGHVGILDDNFPDIKELLGFPVLGTIATMDGLRPLWSNAVIGIGNAAVRLGIQEQLLRLRYSVQTVVHPRAVISPYATVGIGTVVFAGAVVNPGSTIGEACIINTGATVDHDCILAAGVHVCPGANLAGGVEIGVRSWIGIGASVKQGVKIGRDVIVGAGAAVVNDIPAGTTVVGVPARELRQRDRGG